MTRRGRLVSGLVAALVVVVAATGWHLLGGDDSDDTCSDRAAEQEDLLGQFLPPDQLAPSGSVGEERQPVIDAVEDLGLGPVISGRFYDQAALVPSLVPLGESLLLAQSPLEAQGQGSLIAVTLPDGAPLWGRGFEGAAPGGGLVGGSLVTVLGGSEPTTLTFDPASGSIDGCVGIPSVVGAPTGGTLLADQTGGQVVVAAGPLAAKLTLSKIDPLGAVTWSRRLEGLTEAGSLTVAGSDVVLSRLKHDPVRLAEMAAGGGIGAPMITAYSTAKGNPTWSYPPAAEAASTSALVLGVDDASGATAVLTAHGEERSRAVVLDPQGVERWSTKLGRGFWDGAIWVPSADPGSPLLVLQGPARGGGTELVARSLVDGGPRWAIRSSDLKRAGPGARRDFGPATKVDDRFLVPAPNGLLEVDPATGKYEAIDTSVEIDQLFVQDQWLLVRVQNALLVVDHAP